MRSTAMRRLIALAAVVLAACTTVPPQGSDASAGFTVGDRIVLAADSDLRVGKPSSIPGGFRYSRIFEFNKPFNGFLLKPFCDVALSSEDPVLRAGTEFRIIGNGSAAGPETGKFGIEYHTSKVLLHSTRGDPKARAVIYCTPEDVPKFNLAGYDSSGRMMKTSEVKAMLQSLLQFPDAR